MPRRTTTTPIDRAMLEKLAAGPPDMNVSGIVTAAELDEWAARLEAAAGHDEKRQVIWGFITFHTDKLNAATRHKRQYIAGIAPPQN